MKKQRVKTRVAIRVERRERVDMRKKYYFV
jgi:hypothetical protein